MENTTNWGNYVSLQQTKDNWNYRPSGNSKFKKLSIVRGETNQLSKLRNLISYINEHMFNLWDNYMLFDQRTVGSTVECEGKML